MLLSSYVGKFLCNNSKLCYPILQFGKVERAVVACNEQGRSLCEGVVEFERKNAAQQALQRINNGAFLLTPGPRPLIVEQLEHKLVSSDFVPLMTKIFILI